jgi:hypothetical protein
MIFLKAMLIIEKNHVGLFPLKKNLHMTGNDELFIQLMLIFHQNAMIAMGKLKNPVTDKVERDLMQAKQSIDMLEMIKEKTINNLSPELARTLEHALTELRLNYVDETNKQPTTT